MTSQTGPGGTISYAYNAVGELSTETQGSQKAAYTYNGDGWLKTEAMPNGITAAYGYDADGLRTSEGGTLASIVLPAAESGNTYNADNELTSFGGKTYSYDPDGNLLSDGTNTYTWNDRGQLVSVSGPSGTSTLGYDPLGRLISTTVGGVTTTFAYQGSQLLSDTGSNGTDLAFLNGPYGTLSQTNDASGAGGAVQTYLPDPLGSTLALVNSAGNITTSYSYDLYGNTTSSGGSSDTNPIRYTGLISGPVMPAGLQDNNARDYSPATGQFISPDPTGMAGSGDNLYSYAGGDPIDNSDPSGLQWQLLAACAGGGLANDVGGALDGRKHSVGDFFTGVLTGCLNGALFVIPGAEEALDALEGADAAGDAATSVGIDGGEDLSDLGDDLSGDGTGEDGQGEDPCTTQPNSFPAATRVVLADGKTVPISNIKPGDYVKATNPTTGKTTAEPVLAIIKGHKNEKFDVLTIMIGVGRHYRNHSITATAGHLIYDVTRQAWIDADKLHIGDQLYTLNHVRSMVSGIRTYPGRPATAYNLTVGSDHDYYVDVIGTSILVHNDCDIPPGAPRRITGYTTHGLGQVLARDGGHGVAEEALYDAVEQPDQVIEQNDGAFKYIGTKATVVLNSDGDVVTAWATTRAGWRYP